MIVSSSSLGSQQVFILKKNTSIATFLDDSVDWHHIMVDMLEFLDKISSLIRI